MLVRDNIIDIVVNYYRELSDLIGLPNGRLRITINQAQAVKIEVFRKSRICSIRLSANEWGDVEGEEKLVLELAPEFVTSRLESLIVDMVGRFGYVEGVIREHEVAAIVLSMQLQAVA